VFNDNTVKTAFSRSMTTFLTEKMCVMFGQLILGKIIKIVATRCPILRLKCTKFDLLTALPQAP